MESTHTVTNLPSSSALSEQEKSPHLGIEVGQECSLSMEPAQRQEDMVQIHVYCVSMAV